MSCKNLSLLAILALNSFTSAMPTAGEHNLSPRQIAIPFFPGGLPFGALFDSHRLLGYDQSLASLFSEDSPVPILRILRPSELIGNITSVILPGPASTPEATPSPTPLAPANMRYISGADDRVYNPDGKFPYSAIGRLVWENGVYCTATLVGPRHILSARHCLPSQAGTAGMFQPGYNNGEPNGSAFIVRASVVAPISGACDTKSDWAVFLLDDRLGDKVGYMGVSYASSSGFGQPKFTHQGYPRDKNSGSTPQRQLNNTILRTSLDCDSSGPLYSDTDTAGGQSGGPLFETRSDGQYIWGVLSISVTSSQTTYAGWASGDQMINAVANLRKDYP
jgi:V8-like Glu-specific endopeptidase